MRIAVSNIAWPPEARREAYGILSRHGATGLEIAPGLLFAGAEDPFDPPEAAVSEALEEISSAGLALVSMQSLLFGVDGAALFGDAEERSHLERGMARAIALAGRLGVPNLVFGSPKQRVIPEGMSGEDAARDAAATLRRLGDLAADAGTVIAMESNPADYGTNFLTTFPDAADFVARTDHDAVTLVLDMGAMHMNDQADDLEARLAPAAGRLSHVHMSEPFLAPAPGSVERARPVLGALRSIGYDGAVSIEMKSTAETPLQDMDAALGRLMTARAEAEAA